MKPRAFLDADGSVILGTGSAHHVSEPDGERPVAKLYVPDPEARRGWRELYIPPAPKLGSRPAGFRR